MSEQLDSDLSSSGKQAPSGVAVLSSRSRVGRGVREAVANIAWLGSDRVMRMLGGIVVSASVARYLGPDRFGQLNYALAIYSLFNVVSNLGLDYLVVREVTLWPDKEDEILGTAFWLKTVGSVVTTVAGITAAYYLSRAELVVPEIVAILSVASISQGLDVIDYFFQAKIRSKLSVIPRNVVFVAASIARLVAIANHVTLLAFGWIAAFEVVFSEIGLAIVYFRVCGQIRHWLFLPRRALSLLKEGWPLMIAAIMFTVYMRTDQVMLGRMAGSAAVGQYTAAARLSEIWYVVPALICNSVMPRILRDRISSPSRYLARMQQLYSLMVTLSIALGLCATFSSRWIIALIYGKQFHNAAGILTIHIWSAVFVFIGTAGAGHLLNEGLTILELQRATLGTIVNLLLNWAWIPRYGAVGSAYATLCTHAATAYVADLLSAPTRYIFWMKTRAFTGFGLIYSRSTEPSPHNTQRI